MYRRLASGKTLQEATYVKEDRGSYLAEGRAWRDAVARCHNPAHPSYKHYGARGIAVYDEWRASFQAFLDHVGLKPHPYLTLERIDNDKGYEPGNVKWASRKEQRANQRKRQS